MAPATADTLTIITGASRGLGEAMALALLRQPHHSVLHLARSHSETLAQTAAEHHNRLEQWQCDLSDPQPVAQRLRQWLQQLPAGQYAELRLINNAASQPAQIAPLADTDWGDISRTLRVGLEAPMVLTSAFLQASRALAAQGVRCKVLNISSSAGLERYALGSLASYSASKAALDQFTRCLALEEAAQPHGAQVAAIHPGVVDTAMHNQLRSTSAEQFPAVGAYASLKTSGQVRSAQDTAATLLDSLASSHFGQQPVVELAVTPNKAPTRSGGASFTSQFCQHLYDMAREQRGRNEVQPQPDGRRLLVIQNLDDADIVMRRNVDNYLKNYQWFSQVAGNSRFTDDGEPWKFRQALSQPFFNRYDPARAFSVSQQHAQHLAQQLRAEAGAEVLDESLIHQHMLAIFVEMFLEVDLSQIPMPHDSASRLTELASNWAFVEPGSATVHNSKELIREILQLRKNVFGALQGLRSQPAPSPMLQAMLDAEKQPEAKFMLEKELTMMLGAGTDTASYSVGWALHLLAAHPAMQERLHQGMAAIYARHGDDAEALQQAVCRDNDLRCFVSEVLRLYPTAPFVPRIAKEADQLSDIAVQAGDVVVVSLIGVSDKGQARANPWVPDLDAAAEEGLGFGSGMVSAFAWGKRICGGRSFALVELATVLSVLIRELRFESTSTEPVTYEWIGQMRRQGGHRVRVVAR